MAKSPTLPPSRLLAVRAGVGAWAPIVDITFADDPNKLCDRIKIIPRFDGFATSRQDAIAIFGNDPSRLEARPQPIEHVLYRAAHRPSNPRPSAAPPPIGFLITGKPDRPRCPTRRLIADMSTSALWTRLRPLLTQDGSVRDYSPRR